jgi:hypothetical protein
MSEEIETEPDASAPADMAGEDMHIHKPKPWHSPREFLSEISVIMVGIAIALAGEQVIESVHRNIEVSALRADLHEESRQILVDAKKCEDQTDYELLWLNKRIAQVRAAAWYGQSLAEREPNNRPTRASPDIPIWRSARSGGTTGLLTKGELNAYAEVEYVQTHLDSYYEDSQKAEIAVRDFNRRLPTLPSGEPDFSVASRDDMKHYLALLAAAANSTDKYKEWLRVLTGMEKAVVAGKSNLGDTYASKREASAGDVTHNPM